MSTRALCVQALSLNRRLRATTVLMLSTGFDLAASPPAPQSPVAAILTAEAVDTKSVHQIPAPVVARLLSLMKHDPRLASAGEAFNATDVVWPNRAMRRLVLARGNSSSWLVYYEHGGRGYHRHLVVFSVAHDSAECRCVGNVAIEVADSAALRAANENGLVKCDPCPKEPEL